MATDGARPPEGFRWWVFGERTPLLEAVLSEPDRVLASEASVARARMGRKRFYRVAADGQGPALYVKVFEIPRGLRRAVSAFRASKARKEARTAEEIRARGFDVTAPLAVGEERRLGALRRSFLVTVERPGTDLRKLLADSRMPRAKRLKLLLEFGAMASRLHDAGIDQDDFSPNNFLVDASGRLVLLDFERCRLRSELGDRRWTLLAKLHRHELGVCRTERLRFLRAYLRWGNRIQRREAWERIEREFWKVRRRDARRAARRAFRTGRHVAREGRSWVVRGREEARTRLLELPRREARRAWVLAHQLERLGLPALRPVRLGRAGLEMLEPGPSAEARDRERQARRAARRLRHYGVFTREPQWVFGPEGALLADPSAFRLTL
jgi:tRNA A-37 threonylcarbamoyl transferase component Bud32